MAWHKAAAARQGPFAAKLTRLGCKPPRLFFEHWVGSLACGPLRVIISTLFGKNMFLGKNVEHVETNMFLLDGVEILPRGPQVLTSKTDPDPSSTQLDIWDMGESNSWGGVWLHDWPCQGCQFLRAWLARGASPTAAHNWWVHDRAKPSGLWPGVLTMLQVCA